MRKSIFTLILLFWVFNSIAQVHTTYLWHLQQPIYWPDKGQVNPFHYQAVKESYDIKQAGGNQYGTGVSHPTNNLADIFGNDDRRNVYQQGVKNAVQQLLGYPDAGAQVNYSGCLIENVNSLANANMWGYYSGWQNNYVTARGWQTSGGFPRLDIVGFTFHHALGPLISERAFRKELEAHRLIYGNTFGHSPEYTKGYWPAECCFTERNIQILVEEGFQWSVVANSHLSRTLNDYPLHYGTNGCNISPPNKADKVATHGVNWWNGQIDGRGGEFAAPYCYQAHKAQYVNPTTGQVYTIDVVPMADLLSYKDGYSQQGTGDIDANIKPYDNPLHPSIVLFAHDGDNAWGGGSSYYYEAVPNFVAAATNDGMVPTTIQQFLHDNPVPSSDVVHVEDGGWVNAANDWGSPQFINWLWPLYSTATYEFDPNAWTEDARNWAVIIAIDNYVCMAEDLAGGVDMNKVVYSDASSSNAEKAWAFYMPALTSGYMYYGTAEDMEVKQTIAGNNAIEFAQNEINAHPGVDNTPPSVFIPQRFPYNPGGKEFGPIYGYKEHISSKDFTVWTFGYDVSGIQSAVLKYRLDKDGVNPLTDSDNDTYTGGPGVGSWNSIDMIRKLMDSTYTAGNPEVNFFVLPKAMGRLYYGKITGLSDTLVDYYVEMTDSHGNTFKTPIQHVYVGNEEGSGSGSSTKVYWKPENPTLNDVITIYSTEAVSGSQLHWGVTVGGNAWTQPISDYWPSGTVAIDNQSVETPFVDADTIYKCVIGPFNQAGQKVDQVNFVLKLTSNSWDNNNGQNYSITINNNPNDNPVGSDVAVSMLTDATYTFSTDDFYFQSPDGATFSGIQVGSAASSGTLKYNGTVVSAPMDCADVSLLTFTPDLGASGAPYAQFQFKVIDSEGRYSDETYHATLNVYDENPLGDNNSVTMIMNGEYAFSDSDFPFTGMNGATFAGIKITGMPAAGNLAYDGTTVALNESYSDVSKLTFTPVVDQTGSPYASFTFKVLDNQGHDSNESYTMTVNVIQNYPDGVSWYPENPTENDVITIVVNNDATMTTNGGSLHWGVNKTSGQWTLPINAYWPANTVDYGDGHSVETPFESAGSTAYKVELGPFNNAGQKVTSVHFVLHYDNNTWNNNSNNDWNISLYTTAVPNVNKEQDKISVYPNPVKDRAWIDIQTGDNDHYYLFIQNLNGQPMKSVNMGTARHLIFYSHLKSGMYVFRFVNADSGKVISKKIVIE
ncbi:MAG: T9SS type A sorting domain-containing protein [Bacteroidales bacterium]|nr:T9SS type A sorting domain-containing protein [Bacteroidales bacterium]